MYNVRCVFTKYVLFCGILMLFPLEMWNGINRTLIYGLAPEKHSLLRSARL